MQLLCRKSDQLKEQDMAPVKAVIVTVAVVSPAGQGVGEALHAHGSSGEGPRDRTASGGAGACDTRLAGSGADTTGGDEGGAFLGNADHLTDFGASFCGIACLKEVGQGNGGEDADDRHHDHQLDEGEALGDSGLLFAHAAHQGQFGFGGDVHGEKR